jgi:hypothetical protein
VTRDPRGLWDGQRLQQLLQNLSLPRVHGAQSR